MESLQTEHQYVLNLKCALFNIIATLFAQFNSKMHFGWITNSVLQKVFTLYFLDLLLCFTGQQLKLYGASLDFHQAYIAKVLAFSA